MSHFWRIAPFSSGHVIIIHLPESVKKKKGKGMKNVDSYTDLAAANRRIKYLETKISELNKKIEEAVNILDTVEIDSDDT